MKQRVLVLGAGGFIGRRVVAALAATDWASPIAAGHRAPLPAEFVHKIALDAADGPALAQAIAGADAVVNCVAGGAATIVATARALATVSGRAGAAAPLRRIELSSMAVYGSAVGVVDETAPLNGDLGAYGAAKVQAERIAAASGRPVTLRPGCVYGPGSAQWSERIARWLAARRVGDLGAAGEGTCNLVHVNDVVAAILAALRLPRIEGEAFNLGSPAPPTWNEYFLAYARALGAVPIRRISRRRLALETRLWAAPLKGAELAVRLAGLRGIAVPAPIPRSLLKSWSQDIRLDVRKAQRVLGVAWTPARAGLRETATQWRAAA